MAKRYELPDELWDIVKTYQLNWEKTAQRAKHKKYLFKVAFEINYLYEWHGESESESFSKSYFNRDYGGWDLRRESRLKYIEQIYFSSRTRKDLPE